MYNAPMFCCRPFGNKTRLAFFNTTKNARFMAGCVRLTLLRNRNTCNNDKKSLIREYEMALNISCVSECLQKYLLKLLERRNLTAIPLILTDQSNATYIFVLAFGPGCHEVFFFFCLVFVPAIKTSYFNLCSLLLFLIEQKLK